VTELLRKSDDIALPHAKAADLPNDVEALKGIILERSSKLEVAEALLISQKLELEKLRFEIAYLKRMKYGRSSEQLDRKLVQMQLCIEDLEASLAEKPLEVLRACVRHRIPQLTAFDPSAPPGSTARIRSSECAPNFSQFVRCKVTLAISYKPSNKWGQCRFLVLKQQIEHLLSLQFASALGEYDGELSICIPTLRQRSGSTEELAGSRFEGIGYQLVTRCDHPSPVFVVLQVGKKLPQVIWRKYAVHGRAQRAATCSFRALRSSCHRWSALVMIFLRLRGSNISAPATTWRT
jgi:hypothetical protein